MYFLILFVGRLTLAAPHMMSVKILFAYSIPSLFSGNMAEVKFSILDL